METTYEIVERFYISLVKIEIWNFIRIIIWLIVTTYFHFLYMYHLKAVVYSLEACGKSSLEAQFVFT